MVNKEYIDYNEYLVKSEAIKASGTYYYKFKELCEELEIEPVERVVNGKKKLFYKKADMERIKKLTDPILVLNSFFAIHER